VLTKLLTEFDRNQIRYASIGGFALGVLGVPRATLDLDFLVHRDDLEKLNESLTRLGYQRWLSTENVSQYRHSQSEWGSVDFIHAFRKHALGMLSRSQSHPIFSGSRTVRVAEPEDIIGLKVQAMVNDPDRKRQEEADIARLMAFYREKLDWNRLEDLYKIFELEKEAKKLRKKYGRVKR